MAKFSQGQTAQDGRKGQSEFRNKRRTAPKKPSFKSKKPMPQPANGMAVGLPV